MRKITPKQGTAVFPHRDGVRCFGKPRRVVVAHTVAEVLPALLDLDREVAAGAYVAGFIHYEAAPAFDPALQCHAPGPNPLLHFGVYDAVDDLPALAATRAGILPMTWTPGVNASQYRTCFERIQQYIAAGNTYQVNYTFPFSAQFEGDAWNWFCHGVAAQGMRVDSDLYPAYIDLGAQCVLSLSPELFFRLDGEQLYTKPMKGTAKRGRFPDEDEQGRQALATSDKDRAENVMIVDMLRNDMGRVSTAGSVKVDALFDTEAYETVWQMTSRIHSHCEAPVPEIFRALFPSGSVTGAPKVETMRIIRELETVPRGVYCGAIGWWGPNRQACFNVGIRTLTLDRSTGRVQYAVGSGVTTDSSSEGEYAECLAKAAVLHTTRPDFELLETMLANAGEVDLLEEHCARMVASARYFGFPPLEHPVMKDYIARAVANNSDKLRLRVLYSASGKLRHEAIIVDDNPEATRRIGVAREAIDSRDVFLFHKTTNRAVYDGARASRPDVDDVLLFNERGEATECTLANVVIERDGRKLTPAVECGLLAGTMRESLLRSGEIEEAVLTVAAVTGAARCWVINSVRGWVPVEWVV